MYAESLPLSHASQYIGKETSKVNFQGVEEAADGF